LQIVNRQSAVELRRGENAMSHLVFCGILVLAVAPVSGQQAGAKEVNELIAGKLIYVAPMPNNIDQWITDFLRRWGKYKVTGNPEGVDLVLKAIEPNKETEWEKHQGIPQPKGTGSRLPAPFPRRGKKEDLPVVSVEVVDWVRNQRIWRADVLDRKQKKDEPEPPAGPETTIFAHGMTPDAIAMKVTRTLQAYVAELEKTGTPRAEGEKQ
jgi:hypothetical protein